MRAVRGGDGAVGIFGTPLRHFGERLLCGRVVGDHHLATRRCALLAINEEAVARSDQGELFRLRCW